MKNNYLSCHHLVECLETIHHPVFIGDFYGHTWHLQAKHTQGLTSNLYLFTSQPSQDFSRFMDLRLGVLGTLTGMVDLGCCSQGSYTHRIHVWYICLHLSYKLTTCRYIYQSHGSYGISMVVVELFDCSKSWYCNQLVKFAIRLLDPLWSSTAWLLENSAISIHSSYY